MKFEWDFTELVRFSNNLENDSFKDWMKTATEEIARVLLETIKRKTPVVTGELLQGWSDNNIGSLIKVRSNGYEVILVNKVEYASAVNNGHYSYNQYNKGGKPYIVRNRTVPYDGKFGGNYPNADTYVFGRFFVEKSIFELSESKSIIEGIIMEHLQDWWSGV